MYDGGGDGGLGFGVLGEGVTEVRRELLVENSLRKGLVSGET